MVSLSLLKMYKEGFPGGPVVKILPFQWGWGGGGGELDPWSGN